MRATIRAGTALLCLAALASGTAAAEPTAFETDFVAHCIPSLRSSSFYWMPQRLVPSVCQCAAPRIEQRLREMGLEGGAARSATELARITNNISILTLDCARPAFVATMLQYGADACSSTMENEPRLKSLDQKSRTTACACVATRVAGAADFGLAVQPAKSAEFDRSKVALLEQAKEACFKEAQAGAGKGSTP